MKSKSDLIPRFLLYALTFAAATNLYVIFFYQRENKILVSDLLIMVLNALSVFALFLAASQYKEKSKSMSLAWYFIALAQLSFTIGDLLLFIFEGILHIETFPSIADLFYLLYYPIIFLGILLIPHEKTSKIKLTKDGIDFILVLLSASLVLWFFLLNPSVAELINEPFLVKLLTLAYPTGDLILFSALLILIYSFSNEKARGAFLFLITSIFIQIITDVIYSSQLLAGSYSSASWVSSGWVFGYLFLGIAGAIQLRNNNQALAPGIIKYFQNLSIEKYIEKIQTYLPYFIVIFSYTFPIFYISDEIPKDLLFLTIVIGVVIILSMTRQYIVIVENKKLNKKLEGALSDLEGKSFELQKTNDKLSHEIIERKKIEEQLSFDALHDGLTKLPNRTLFLDRLNHAFEISKRNKNYSFSVLFIDLDQFKNVNDTLGHSTGDELLIKFSERIKKCIRNVDTFARLGGDEFTILLEDHEIKQKAVEVADRIQQNLHEPYLLSGQKFFITASIGIVNDISENYDNAEAILRDADIAMYRAKELGRARYQIFDPQLSSVMLSRINLETQMRSALAEKSFILHYQPIYTLENNSLIGFEALLRWNHPKLGLLMPADFLSIAESSGLIIEIGNWVLLEACRQMKKWINESPRFQDLSINVNFSGKQFAQSNFMDRLKSALRETGLPPKCLHLEITETVLIENQDLAVKIFDELHKLGIELQIDDFGSGYSSMGYIQRFPIDTIKIDRSFIHDLEKNKKSTQIVQTIIKMAGDMGMKIVAEGIETNTQLMKLKTMACNYGQGFYLSYPMPIDKIEKILQKLQK
ncbi:MAG: putative bifunctional diguanylate cyclase/phosphodiesterase [Anaerolineaceae bacterium]